MVVDASPAWGSDFGGPPAFLPAFAFFVLAVAGVRLTWRRALLIGGGTVLFLVAIGFADWLRPPESRSHLGRFVQTAIDGGAATIILRKARQNWDILTSSTPDPAGPDRPGLRRLHPGAADVLGVPRAAAGLRAGAAAAARAACPLLVLFLIGFAANDSGTAIPAVGATLALPLVIALSVRTLLDETSPDGDHARHASHATTAQTSHPAYGATERRTASVNASTPALIATTRPGT